MLTLGEGAAVETNTQQHTGLVDFLQAAPEAC